MMTRSEWGAEGAWLVIRGALLRRDMHTLAVGWGKAFNMIPASNKANFENTAKQQPGPWASETCLPIINDLEKVGEGVRVGLATNPQSRGQGCQLLSALCVSAPKLAHGMCRTHWHMKLSLAVNLVVPSRSFDEYFVASRLLALGILPLPHISSCWTPCPAAQPYRYRIREAAKPHFEGALRVPGKKERKGQDGAAQVETWRI